MDGCRAETTPKEGTTKEYLRADRLALRRPRCSRRKPDLHALTRQRPAPSPFASKSGMSPFQAVRDSKSSASHSVRERNAVVTLASPSVSMAVALNSTIQARHL